MKIYGLRVELAEFDGWKESEKKKKPRENSSTEQEKKQVEAVESGWKSGCRPAIKRALCVLNRTADCFELDFNSFVLYGRRIVPTTTRVEFEYYSGWIIFRME